MKKVIVIGGGISGLTASICLSLKGFEVHLYEKNAFVGGLANGFYINGQYVDTCLHWLMGTLKGTKINDIHRLTHAITDEVEIIKLPSLGTFSLNGIDVTFYRDLEKAEKEWIKISPEDEEQIKQFFEYTKDLSTLVLATENDGLIKNIEVKPALKRLTKQRKDLAIIFKESREVYARRFKNEAIRNAIINFQNGYNSMAFAFIEYGLFAKGDTDLPKGGVVPLINRMKERLLSLGGHLHLSTEVNKIVTEKKKAIGILANNELIKADIVLSCCDPLFTIENLLENKYKYPLYQKLKRNIEKNPISSCYSLFVSVKKDLSYLDVPTGLNIGELNINGKIINTVFMRPYYYDDSFKKEGETLVSFLFNQDQNDFDYWKNLHDLSSEEYKREKEYINEFIITKMCETYNINYDDVTYLTSFGPLELNKLTNSSYGAIQSFSFLNGIMRIAKGKIEGLKNFYMASQWSRSIGGTPTAVIYAKKISDLITKENKK